MDIVDKRVVVTGAASGIGKALAVEFKNEKAKDVVLADLNEEVLKVAEELGFSGFVLNVGKEDEVKDLISFANEKMGGIDIFCSNAGIGGEGRKIEDIDLTIFDEMMRVHVAGAFFATKALLPQMKSRKKGKIINISSIFAQIGHFESSHYVAAKSAISGLTKSWAREFAKWNITVNAVAPGFIETDMTRLSTTPDQIAALECSVPLGRLCRPIDISYTVGWLASSQADQMTGQTISPNAGQVIA